MLIEHLMRRKKIEETSDIGNIPVSKMAFCLCVMEKNVFHDGTT